MPSTSTGKRNAVNHPAENPSLAPLDFAVRVACPPARAFEYFTRDIHEWWPLGRFSVAQEDARGVVVEPFVGGRVYETDKAGNTHEWGVVREWLPPGRVVLSWHPGRPAEQAMWVAVTFTAERDHTLVQLSHGGWEAVGSGAGRARDNYKGGWLTVLDGHFEKFVRKMGA